MSLIISVKNFIDNFIKTKSAEMTGHNLSMILTLGQTCLNERNHIFTAMNLKNISTVI